MFWSNSDLLSERKWSMLKQWFVAAFIGVPLGIALSYMFITVVK